MAPLVASFRPAMRVPIMVPLKKFRSSEIGHFVENPVIVFGTEFWGRSGGTRGGEVGRVLGPMGLNGTHPRL